MGTGLCQVKKPTTFTGRKTSTLSYSQKWAHKFLLLFANRKSANSQAHSAIANPQISEMCLPQIANPQICND